MLDLDDYGSLKRMVINIRNSKRLLILTKEELIENIPENRANLI